jgi:hypothetical protein
VAQKKPDAATVTVYPSPDGRFFDGIAAVVQDVSEADAEWMCRHGVFTREPPPAPPPAVDIQQPEGPADAGPSDSTEV